MSTSHLFVTRGDLTRLRADIVVIPTSTEAQGTGKTISAAMQRWGVEAINDLLQRARPNLTDAAGSAAGSMLRGVREDDPRGVVLVATVQSQTDGAIVEQAARNAIAEALRLLAAPEVAGRPRLGPKGPGEAFPARALIAIGALGTGEARGEQRRGLAAAQVRGIRQALDDRNRHMVDVDVDVVLVAWDDDLWATFVEARDAAHPTELGDEEAEIVQAIRSDACVLFVGAGLSRGMGLPDWQELTTQMGRIGQPAGQSEEYPNVAEHYVQLHGAQAHHALIRDLFGGERWRSAPLSLAHYLLLQLPFRHVVTTNYDGLVEHALDALRRPARKVVRNDEVAQAGTRGLTTVFKIHGDASDPEGLREVVLTRTEYDRFETRHRAKAALLQALLLNHHFLFVGYSLSDPNLNTIRGAVQAMLAGSQRKAWVTRFPEGTAQPDAAHPLTWMEQPSAWELWRMLDRIAARCVDLSRSYLADGRTSEGTSLREQLLAVGRSLHDEILHGRVADHERSALATTLAALEALGWRPEEAGSRFLLWRRLAEDAADPLHRSEWWSNALACARNEEEASAARTGLLLARTTHDAG